LELGELMIEAQKGSYYEFGELSQYVRDISESYFLTRYKQKDITKLADIDDLTNSVFLSFAEEYKNIENLGYWLRRVLFITFIRWSKKQKIRASNKQSSIMSTGNNGTDEKELLAAQVTKVLNTITEEKQKIVRLKFWAHLDFKQIADYLNKSEADVRKSYYNTLLAIKNRLR
jgi:RNA polymerase sigma factor (sigma-70 family)